MQSERTFDICHESRCLQYKEDMGFFLRVITSDKELRDTGIAHGKNKATLKRHCYVLKRHPYKHTPPQSAESRHMLGSKYILSIIML